MAILAMAAFIYLYSIAVLSIYLWSMITEKPALKLCSVLPLQYKIPGDQHPNIH